MSSQPKDFQKTTKILPIATYGLSSVEEFHKAESENRRLELLRRAGLSDEELKLYHQNEAGVLDDQTKIESSVLKNKVEEIYTKIKKCQSELNQSNNDVRNQLLASPEAVYKVNKKTINFYPEGHPMNEIKQLEEDMFGHLRNDILPITKRRKILRHLERKKQRVLAQCKEPPLDLKVVPTVNKSGSLWDVTSIPHQYEKISRYKNNFEVDSQRHPVIGPKNLTKYTIKENKIVRLEPTQNKQDEYQAVDIVVPVNQAEEQLLEGTKMNVDDIKKIDRFKDYKPGIPSKVLYLKNIAPSVTEIQLSLLFNQFVRENGGPIDVRLMSGRMRGQAFVTFQNENLAVQALEDVNGTILSGRPIIVQFGRNSNHIEIQENR